MKRTASIVIPVYNRAHLVSRAIDSALAQTVPCEVILVDHGSSDDIASVAEKYSNRILYVRREYDNGPVASWIDGAEHANGEYLHFTYDDDWIEPTFMERCINSFTDEVAFVYSQASIYDTSLNHLGVIFRHPSGVQPIERIVQHLLLKPLTISPGCATFRRRDVLKNLLNEVPGACGIYGAKSGVGEDLLLFLLTSLNYKKYVHLEAPLASFLSHSGSITVNAQDSGNASALAGAYDIAKLHYLAQPGATKKLENLLLRFRFTLNWRLSTMHIKTPFV